MVFSDTLIEPEGFGRLGPVVLVGHRGSGKSTLGRLVAARLNRPYFDLDEELQEHLSESFAAVLKDDPRRFREKERAVLSGLLGHQPSPIISCGAGIGPIPSEAFVVWIDRDGWQEEVLCSDRPRVRPELTLEDEWTWMKTTREPRWRKSAHLRLYIPQSRTPQRSLLELETLLRWSAQCAEGPVASRTFFVPMNESDLPRALSDARRLGMAGVEFRSDVFETLAPETLTSVQGSRYIASLRHDDPQWLEQMSRASIWDIDVEFIDAFLNFSPAGLPERILISSHPEAVHENAFDELDKAASRCADRLGVPHEKIALKYAPLVSSWDELEGFLNLAERFRESPRQETLLPRSSRFAWMRPILAHRNLTNYLPIGLRSRNLDHPSAMDFQDFLPHLAGRYPRSFDALIGDPVSASQGDIWHRRAALSEIAGNDKIDVPLTSYLKIPVSRGQLHQALSILTRLPIRGLSITSPLKREAIQSDRVENPEHLKAVNTLRRTDGDDSRWQATDTDEAGMDASLQFFETQGISPGRAVVLGRGGASFAVLRALKSRNWTVAEHLSGRNGWQTEHLDISNIDLIINASGTRGERTSNTPPCRAWLDLHYNHVSKPPTDVIHLQGDLFFDAQARAQRLFWSRTSNSVPSKSEYPQ